MISVPVKGSRWAAMYRWAGEFQGWHDESRFYEITDVDRSTVYYRWAGTWDSVDSRPSFTTPIVKWAEWTSEEGGAIGRGERLKMVPA